jgi:hypothetical protein
VSGRTHVRANRRTPSPQRAQRTTASAKPSQPLVPNVWFTVASTARFGGKTLHQTARTAGGGAVAVHHRAVPHHVVDHDHLPGPRQAQGMGQKGRVVRLVGVDEDQIERP